MTVADTGGSHGPRLPRPLRVVVLTIAAVVVISLVGVAQPHTAGNAASATLELDPPLGEAGALIRLQGHGLLPYVPYQLTWDGSATGQPDIDTDGQGSLDGALTVPAASPGAHVLSLFPVGHVVSTAVSSVATATFTVVVMGTPLPSTMPPYLAAPIVTPTPLATAATGVSAAATPRARPHATPKPKPPKPPPSDPWSVPFMARPASGPIVIQGRSGVRVSGKRFVDLGANVSAIRIIDSHNVVIEANDFENVAEGIFVKDSTNVTIEWNRYENITGPSARVGINRGNFTQWDNSFGGAIEHNKGIGGDTEDIVSMFQSGGTDSGHPLLIEDNAFEGTNWSSSSSSGIMLGDGGGSHIVVSGNILVSPGQVGIEIAGGTDIHVVDNRVYGAARALSNVGIAVWNQAGGACSGNEIRGNDVTWYKADGSRSGAWNGGGCGSVAGWGANDFNANLSYASLHVRL